MQRTGYFQHKIHKKPFATLRYADRAAGNHTATFRSRLHNNPSRSVHAYSLMGNCIVDNSNINRVSLCFFVSLYRYFICCSECVYFITGTEYICI